MEGYGGDVPRDGETQMDALRPLAEALVRNQDAVVDRIAKVLLLYLPPEYKMAEARGVAIMALNAALPGLCE